MRRPRGSRSSHDGVETWTCKQGVQHRLERHEFFAIPKLVCRCGCKQEYPGNFDFCIADIEVNDQNFVGEPLNQGNEKLCVSFAFAKQMEITKRVKAVLQNRNANSVPTMDPYDLKEKELATDAKHETIRVSRSDQLKEKCYNVVGQQEGLKTSAELIQMVRIIKEKGIVSLDKRTIFKASDVSIMSRKDQPGIVAALADGYPLHAGTLVGNKLSSLRYCQSYKPPRREVCYQKMKSKKKAGEALKPLKGHAFVLIGAVQKNQKLPYYYVNSWKRFCIRRNLCGQIIRKGIGKIEASRLSRNVIRISRFKQLPSNMSIQPQNGPVTRKCYNYRLLRSC